MPPGCRRRPETPEGRSIVVLAEETYETYGVRVRPTGWVKHLLQEVWRVSQRDKTIHLRVYMAQLRRKWEADPSHPRHLITEPGMGYRFEGSTSRQRAVGV